MHEWGKRANERSKTRERSEQCGASERASERSQILCCIKTDLMNSQKSAKISLVETALRADRFRQTHSCLEAGNFPCAII